MKARDNDIELVKARPYLPVVVLSVDPGQQSGAAILDGTRPGPPVMHQCQTVDIMSDMVERMITTAYELAAKRQAMLVFVYETWGRGGLMGLDAWVGLGEKRGGWKRAAHMIGNQYPNVVTATTQIQCGTWRKYMIPETGDRSTGTFAPFTPDGWKAAAAKVVAKLYPDIGIDSPDEAESMLIGTYALQSIEVCKVVPKRYLNARDFDASGYSAPPKRKRSKRKEPPEVVIKKVVTRL